MPIRLNSWKAKDSDYKRIYVEGLRSSDKVWLTKGRGGGVSISPGSLREDEVRQALLDTFGLADLDWDELWSKGQEKVPRGKAPRAAGFQTTVPNSLDARGWTTIDAEALDADAMAHPLPEPVELLVDHREPPELIARLRTVHNLVVTETSLDVGDYAIPGVLTIERKTIQDFVASVVEEEKRLFKQTNAVMLEPGSAVLLLEGDVYGQRAMSLPSITGTLSYLAVIQGVSIVPTISLPHTVYMIVKLVRHRLFGLGYNLALRGAAPKDRMKAPGFLLEGLPGVSAALAGRLLAHFGSARAVANASVAQLVEVEGIGPGRAKTIFDVFGAEKAARNATREEAVTKLPKARLKGRRPGRVLLPEA